MTTLSDISQLFGVQLTVAFLVFLRIGAMVSLLPAFGERTIPMRIKLVVSFAFTIVVATAVPPLPLPTGGLITWGGIILAETSTGFLLGISVRMFLFALQTAGAIAAQSTSLAQLLGNAGADPLPAIGHILSLGGLTLLLIMGFHVKAAHFMIGSYKVLEFGQAVEPAIVAEWGIFQVSRAFALAFQLAAPFYLVSLIYNLTLGAINRAMPQLMVALVGAPVITWGALTLLMLTSGVLLSIWQDQVNLFLSNPFRFTR